VSALPERRTRPTIRCLRDDLGIEMPTIDGDLSTAEHPLMEKDINNDIQLTTALRCPSGRQRSWPKSQNAIASIRPIAIHKGEGCPDVRGMSGGGL